MSIKEFSKRNLWKVAFATVVLTASQTFAMIESDLMKESQKLQNCTDTSEVCFQQVKNHFQSYQKLGRSDAFMYLAEQKKTQKSALLIHSYTMSPREMTSFGRHLVSKGYNVVGINLEAHNDRRTYVSMKRVSGKDWEADVRYGLNIAHALGDEVIVVGYSLGGLLATQAALKYPQEIKGVAGIAPSLALRRGAETFSCLGRTVSESSFLGSLAQKFKGSSLSEYEKSFLDGACAIKDILTDLFPLPQNTFNTETTPRDWREPMRDRLSELKMPVYISLTELDEILDVPTLEYIIKEIPNLQMTYYPASQQVSHLSIIRLLQFNGSNTYYYSTNLPKMNPEFDRFLSIVENGK